ncbi:MAG TPA: hypothetical protein VFN11_14280 [Ktedonobacterales bacterium]|nr:hypothetical protein [Ktedonobacterales bacterium]
MSEYLCGGVKRSDSEFTNGLTAACGPNALSKALMWSDQSAVAPSTYAVYLKGRTVTPTPVDANGASTAGELEATARLMGYQCTLPNSGEAVSAFLRRLAGIQPVVLEIAAGHNLRDELTGATEDAGPDLAYHYICVWGRNTSGASARTSKTLPAGYWCSDGDNNTQNPVVNGVRVHRALNNDLVYYSDATIAAALPFAAFAVVPRVQVAMEVFTMVPTGWKDDSVAGTLTAPNGVAVVRGFRTYVLNHPWDANNYPLRVEAAVDSVEPGNPSVGAGSRQDFRMGALGYTATRGVYQVWVGQDVLALESQVALLQADLTSAHNQLAALQAQLAQLQQQGGAALALAQAVVAVVNAQSTTQKAA